MPSTTNSRQNNRPATSRTSGEKAAIIRPVNRGNGKESYVRIDVQAAEAKKPNFRALQLEDYVAQIREHSSTFEPTSVSANLTQKEQIVVDQVAQKQQLTTRQLTRTEHLDVLQAVEKLDHGQKWIDARNRSAALEAMEQRRQISDVAVHQGKTSQNTSPEVSQELVSNIAAAIASVLTDQSEKRISQKLKSEKAQSVTAKDEDSLRLEPEVPRHEPTLPLTSEPAMPPQSQSQTHGKNLNQNQNRSAERVDAPLATKTVSLTAAAWEVPAFRWPAVTDSILTHSTVLARLADCCTEMLAPFGKTIAVTSPTRGQGTSTIAMTLSRLFASENKQVLLIDADMTSPNLSRTIGLEGIGWFADDRVANPIGECIVHAKDSGICVMPLGERITSLSAASDPLFDQLERCIDRVRSEFDIILIDAGPVWQIVDEISSSSHLIDAAMLVNQDTHSHRFAEARERLMDRGIFKFIAAQNSYAKRAG